MCYHCIGFTDEWLTHLFASISSASLFARVLKEHQFMGMAMFRVALLHVNDCTTTVTADRAASSMSFRVHSTVVNFVNSYLWLHVGLCLYQTSIFRLMQRSSKAQIRFHAFHSQTGSFIAVSSAESHASCFALISYFCSSYGRGLPLNSFFVSSSTSFWGVQCCHHVLTPPRVALLFALLLTFAWRQALQGCTQCAVHQRCTNGLGLPRIL